MSVHERSSAPIRISLTGVGGYGGVHYQRLRPLRASGEFELAGVVILPECMDAAADIVRELRADRVPIYPSNAELLKHDRPDLAILPVGIAAHRKLSEEFLAAGVNTLVEKPAAGCVADVDAMVRAEAASPAFLAVGFQDMYRRDVRDLKLRILHGDFGRLRSIAVRGVWLRGDAYYSRNAWAGRRRAPDGTAIFDSPVNNAFAHHLNLALFLAGRDEFSPAHPEHVHGEIYRVRPELETFDVCAVRLSAGGVPVTVLLSHAGSRQMNPCLRLDFDRGRLFWEQRPEGKGWRFEFPDGTVAERHEGELVTPEIYRALAAKVRGENVPIYGAAQAREHAVAVELISALPVRVVPEQFRRYAAGQYDLSGIEDVFDACFARGLLPGELGAPWAAEGDER